MNKNIALLTGFFLLLAPLISELASANEDTYTHDEYVAMLPDWDDIDTGELLSEDDLQDIWQDDNQDMDYVEFMHAYVHDNWMTMGTFYQMNLPNIVSNAIHDSGIPYSNQDFIINAIIYCYFPDVDGTWWMVWAFYNCTNSGVTTDIMSLWMSSEDMCFTDMQSNFPKNICDYSIEALPLKSGFIDDILGGNILGNAVVACLLAGIVIVAVPTYYSHKRKTS